MHRLAADEIHIYGINVMKNLFPVASLTLAIASLTAVGTLYFKRDDIIRNHILDNPEIISDAIGVLQSRDMANRLEPFKAVIGTPFHEGQAGNPNGDVTIVEFSDYNCGFCRKSLADIEKLLNEDKNLRVIYREAPVLAESSKTAALWSLAAAKQGRSRQFHNALFNAGRPNDQSIALAANQAGLDTAQAEQLIASEEAFNELNQNLQIMQQVGFSGTPTFIIGDEIFEGAVGYDTLKEAIEKARQS